MTKVTVTATAATTLTVADIAGLRGANTGTRIRVQQADNSIKTVDIASIAGNVITLKAGQTITAAIGAKVYRGAYGITRNCTVSPSNEYALQTIGQKNTLIRRIWVTYSFEIDEFNIDKAVYYGGMTPQDHLDALMEAGDRGAMDQLVEVFFTDELVAEGQEKLDGTDAAYNETMGLIPAIQKAQEDINKPLVKDFSDCTAPEGSTLEATVVRDFIKEITAAIDSGMYNSSKKVTIFVNKAQERALIELNPVMATYRGVQVMENGLSDQYSYSSFTIKYGNFIVDFEYVEFLDQWEVPLYLIMPQDGVVFYQKPYSHFESTGDKVRLVNSNTLISQGIPNLRFIDRTDYEGNGTGECAIYRAYMDIAIILKGICSGAYRIGLNFQASYDQCNLCDSAGGAKILNA